VFGDVTSCYFGGCALCIVWTTWVSQDFKHVICCNQSFVKKGKLSRPRCIGWMAQFLSHNELFFFYSGRIALPG
jgi:hypothetical protein